MPDGLTRSNFAKTPKQVFNEQLSGKSAFSKMQKLFVVESWFHGFMTSTPNLGTTHGLNCRKDAKNGFFRKFHIDIVNRNFSQLFFSIEKIFYKNIKYFSENGKFL